MTPDGPRTQETVPDRSRPLSPGAWQVEGL